MTLSEEAWWGRSKWSADYSIRICIMIENRATPARYLVWAEAFSSLKWE